MSLSNSNQSLPTFEILVEGNVIPSEIEIISLSITGFPNEATAHISIIDGSPATESFQIINSETFELGKQIEIKLGYESVNQTYFKGEIGSQTIKTDPESGQIATINCFNKEIEKPTSTTSVYTANYGENVFSFSLTRQLDSTSNKVNEFGQLTLPGTTVIKPGDMVTLTGFGQKFSCDLPTRNVNQSIENGAWKTTVTLPFD